MNKQWHYLENQFLNVTERNYKKAMQISNYHDAVLKNKMDTNPDPDYALLYNRYHPLHLALVADYNTWKSKGGSQEGATLNLDQQLALMTGKIENWDTRVKMIYGKTTPQYKAIFPDGRKPFNRGTNESRKDAIQQLALNIGNDPALVAVKDEVDAYYTDLDDALDTQSGAKSVKKDYSSAVGQSVAAAMTMQYRTLGFLINKLDLPQDIANFFAVNLIRESDQRIYTGTLDPLENEGVLIHTFMADDELRLKADGPAPVKFYLGTTPNNTDGNGITVEANQEITIPAKEFNPIDYATHRYLTAVNLTDNTTTKYLVELY
jgi:hypothetical protein